jgi:hypothetical protein
MNRLVKDRLMLKNRLVKNRPVLRNRRGIKNHANINAQTGFE